MSRGQGSLWLDAGATFSPCRCYRYDLWRSWSEGPRVLFIMLNPSTADDKTNDPTIARCEKRARALGFGGLRVANLFALRSTDPKMLRSHPEPIGCENEVAILRAARSAGVIICAWGAHGSFMGRSVDVAATLRSQGIALHALTFTKGGEPGHPLYVGYDVQPQAWSGCSEGATDDHG